MARKGMKPYLGAGVRKFFAEVQKVSGYEERFSNPIPTICLERVRVDKARTVTDHVWISPRSMYQGVPFPDNLDVGDTIAFIAGVGIYDKNGGKDYGFTGIKSIEIISKGGLQCKPITAD
jgi:hypothetical protein